jgi:hypothetical protein
MPYDTFSMSMKTCIMSRETFTMHVYNFNKQRGTFSMPYDTCSMSMKNCIMSRETVTMHAHDCTMLWVTLNVSTYTFNMP